MSGVHTAHDQHPEHADRGARAGVPAAGAALAAAAGERRRRRSTPAARASSATSRCSSRRDRVADHRAAGVAAVGPGRRRPGRGRARTGCCPAATRRGPSACPTSAPSSCDAGDVLRMLTPGGGGWGPAVCTRVARRAIAATTRRHGHDARPARHPTGGASFIVTAAVGAGRSTVANCHTPVPGCDDSSWQRPRGIVGGDPPTSLTPRNVEVGLMPLEFSAAPTPSSCGGDRRGRLHLV